MYTTWADSKAHTRKGKSLAAFSAKNIFQILEKIENLLFTVKISFFAATLLQLHISSII